MIDAPTRPFTPVETPRCMPPIPTPTNQSRVIVANAYRVIAETRRMIEARH